jgi:Flp pilus assembly protein TadD
MLSRLLLPDISTVLLFSMLSCSGLPDCFAQTSPHAQDTAGSFRVQINQPPFDQLELFAFCAGGPMDSYVVQVVQERGTSFTPDSTFIASFPTASFQLVLKSIRPRTSENPPESRKQAYRLLRQAWDAQRNGEYATAEQNYRKALQLAPKSATLHSAYADDLLFSNNYPQAESEARQSLQLWPDNADAHARLALSLTAQKQFVEAEAESREALRIFPQHHSAMFALAVSLPHLHKFKEAIPFLQKIMPVMPNVPELRKLLGISLIETGELDAGLDQLNSYVKAVPADAEGHYYLGVGLRMKGSSAEAHAHFAEAYRLQPSNPQYEAAAHPAEN